MSDRYRWRDITAGMDAERQCREITRILHNYEFPWDIVQSSSLAQFRTFAVPSIGQLLAQTGGYTEHTQKRYDDTVILLAQFIEHDLDSPTGLSAIRRLNEIHRQYDISNGDLLYTLGSLLVVPVRWVTAYGWRPLTEHELAALVHYTRRLGKHMGIKDIPESYREFEAFFDEYEQQNFGYHPGAVRVADATLDLMCTFAPFHRLPARLVRRVTRSFMDDPLLEALGYPKPSKPERLLVHWGLKLRGRIVRLLPPRSKPKPALELPYLRSYPDGYRIEQLGTFGSAGCPIVHVDP